MCTWGSSMGLKRLDHEVSI